MIDMITYAAARKYTDIKTAGIQPDPTVFRFKGIKEYISDLPDSGSTGDVWLVQENSNEYFWDGSHWEPGGGIIDIEDIVNRSVKIVDALPLSDIDLNTNYLTKITTPTYNYGNYCSNKVIYPTDNLPSFATHATKPVCIIIYNSQDGCFYMFCCTYYGNYMNFEYLKADSSYLSARLGYYTGYQYYKYDPQGTFEWTEISSGTLNRTSYQLFTTSSAKKFKIVYINSDKTTGRIFRDANDYEIIMGNDGSPAADYIHANFFEPSGSYLGDPDNTDENDIKKYYINIYTDNAWNIVGIFDLEKAFENCVTISMLTKELVKKSDKPIIASNITIATTDWKTDSTYSNYGYKADITIQGVTADMIADVYFSGASAALGTLAPFCETSANTVTIYCSANDTAVIIDKVVVK